MSGSQKHPDHDRVSEEVRSWYRTSSPEHGYQVARRRFGFYRQHTENSDSGFVIVDLLTPNEVPEFLADTVSYFANRALYIWIEDKDQDAELEPALVAAGFSMGSATTFLAHVGPRPESFQLSDITVEAVTADTLPDYVAVKLRDLRTPKTSRQPNTSSRNWLCVAENLPAEVDSSSLEPATSPQLF